MLKFTKVIRVTHKNDAFTHSVQFFTDRREAQRRYYNVIAADENDDKIDYHSAEWIDSDGNLIEKAIFDYTPDVEPEPEPEPETEAEATPDGGEG